MEAKPMGNRFSVCPQKMTFVVMVQNPIVPAVLGRGRRDADPCFDIPADRRHHAP